MISELIDILGLARFCLPFLRQWDFTGNVRLEELSWRMVHMTIRMIFWEGTVMLRRWEMGLTVLRNG